MFVIFKKEYREPGSAVFIEKGAKGLLMEDYGSSGKIEVSEGMTIPVIVDMVPNSYFTPAAAEEE